MNSFQIAFSVVSPLMVYMFTGILIRRAGIITTEPLKAFNQVLFRLFIPLSLFFNIYSADLQNSVHPRTFLFIGIFLVLSFLAARKIMSGIISDPRDRATVVQGIFRSNYVLFGMVVAASLCDEKGTALISALSALVVPLINIEAVLLFEGVRGEKTGPGHLARSVLKNPLVIAGFLGLIFSFFHLRLPGFLVTPLGSLASAATPVAMVILGGLLSFGSIKAHMREICCAVSGKLVIIPLIALACAVLLGLRGDDLVAVLAVFASPTAVASAPMAQAMGGNGDLAGEIVAMTSIVSLVTIFAFVTVLVSAGLL